MEKHLALLFISFTLSFYAQNKVTYESKSIDATAVDEFRFVGGALACISSGPTEPAFGYLNCLHMGQIRMRISINEVENILGKPGKIIEQNGSEIRVYLLPTNEKTYPYLAITFIDDLVNVIQLTGNSTTSDISFSSINLGDKPNKVISILGSPSEKKDVEEINGVMWIYKPFPITIEFVNESVYSIRIHDNM